MKLIHTGGRRCAAAAFLIATLNVTLIATACGGPAGRPAASGSTRATPLLAACPAGRGTPIAGIRTTMLPCLANPQHQVSVAATHGRPEIVNVWASWCPPCRREIRLLEAAHRTVGGRVLFLGVDSRDTRADALRFLAASDVTYPQVFDRAGTFASRTGLFGVPDTLVVDASGHIVYRWFGELTPERLRYALTRVGEDADDMADTSRISAPGAAGPSRRESVTFIPWK